MVRRLALWNASGLDNLGDRLEDETARRELGRRLPGWTVTTYTPWPMIGNAGRLAIDREGRWPGCGEFDAIVIGGGALLTGPPFAEPGSQFFSLGPFPDRFTDEAPVFWNGVCCDGRRHDELDPAGRAYFRAAIERVGHLSVRNAQTRDFVAGVTARPIDVVPDPAVLATQPRRRRRRPAHRRRPLLGIAVARPVFPASFIGGMAAWSFMNLAHVNEAVVRMRPYADHVDFDDEAFARRYAAALRPIASGFDLVVFGFGAMYGDPLVARRVAAALPTATFYDVSRRTTDETIRLIASVDGLVASRLHACLLALGAGTPFVAVEPGDARRRTKLRELSVAVGAPLLGLDEVAGDAPRRGDAVAGAISTAMADRDRIQSVGETTLREASAHFDRLADVILSAGRRH